MGNYIVRTTTFLILTLLVISGCASRTDGGARVRPLPNQPSSDGLPSGIPLNDGSNQDAYTANNGQVQFPAYPSYDQPASGYSEPPATYGAYSGDATFPSANTNTAPVQPQQPAYTSNAPMIPGQTNANAPSTTNNTAAYQPSQNQTGAVQSLLDEANAAVKANQLERAATALNRAVRLEPNNASIWFDLAQIRLHQGKYEQSEQLANKSISFAKGNQDLVNKNWRVISTARQARGDTAGAEEAMRNAQ